ncbi:DUF3306 domain-containing protein [Polaromonas glacialis]|uniref:DUF3306 domain-containing protein n=1 Tax=Polaromonas glacialis TaxID=866564 RepID=UPI0004983BE9|nr:DUF3306 domain-containing protein [Polaromonas glacialis]
MAEEHSGFLGRWARRKTDALQGKPLDEPAAPTKAAPLAVAAAVSPAALKPDQAHLSAPAASPAEQPKKLLSLDDVKALTQDSDFKPFMARNVGADVRNAAMKKLFTDPHYNVMDGLDIYISDYSIADPIPESMLRQMVGARLLKIFNEDDENNDGGQEAAALQSPVDSLPPDDLNNPTPEAVAQSGNSPEIHGPKTPIAELPSQPEPFEDHGASQPDDHAHSHLRLQPDHAPSAPSAGHGT